MHSAKIRSKILRACGLALLVRGDVQEAGGVREVQEPNDLRREFLPEGSFAVVKEEPQVIICPAYTGPPLQVGLWVWAPSIAHWV